MNFLISKFQFISFTISFFIMFELLYFGSIFCALLNIYLLLFSKNALRSYSNYLFSIILFLEVYFVVSYLLIYSGLIVRVPHLYKIAAPLNFVIPPLAFLYVKSILQNRTRLFYEELMHFIPFILATLNYAPFYFLNSGEKMLVIQKVSESLVFGFRYQAGYVGESYMFYLKVLQTFLYLVFQWKLILAYKHSFTEKNSTLQLSNVLRWVKVFTWIFTIILVGFVFLSFLFSISPTHKTFQIIKLVQGILLSGSFFALSSYILVNPSILIGLPFVKFDASKSDLLTEKASRHFISRDYEREIKLIEDYIKETRAYLKNDISLAQVAVDIHMSTRELSYIINNYYNCRFTDFINSYRVEYFKQLLDEGKLGAYTIEALIKSSGFASKSSFHGAFKKKFNCTPSEYLSSRNTQFLS